MIDTARDARYASHLPVLRTYVQPGQPVVEFGCGLFSTPLLSELAGQLVSMENTRGWMEKVKPLVPSDARFLLVPRKFSEFAELLAPEVTPEHAVFVDGAPQAWRVEAIRIAQQQSARVIIAHDWFDTPSNYGYHTLAEHPDYARCIYRCQKTERCMAVLIRKGELPSGPLVVPGHVVT